MKKKFLVLTLALVVMLTGAGYAYWSDSVTFENTVTTGEFDVNIQGAKLFSVNESSGKYVGKVDNVGLGNEGLTKVVNAEDGDKITFNISNVYPGVGARYEIEVINDGTIPAVFDSAVVSFDESNTEGLSAVMTARQNIKLYKKDGSVQNLGSFNTVTLDQLQATLNSKLANVRLEPGDFVKFEDVYSQNDGESIAFMGMEIALPSTVGDDDPDKFENATMIFDIELNWKQHNKPTV